MKKKIATTKLPRAIASTQSLSAFVKSICDVMRRSNCASALQYVPELTWILFLRILDAQEARARDAAEAVGADFSPALRSPYRWQDWAAPWSDADAHPRTDDDRRFGWKRQQLFAADDGDLFDFINTELLPYLHGLDIDVISGLPNPAASPKQRIIARIMTAVERVRVDSETNLRDILDKVDEISIDHVDDTHFFTLSQVYEDLLPKMGEKNSDGGQFFTPREVIRAMVHTVDPLPGKTVYDPGCGTGGFLAVAYEHIARRLGDSAASTDLDTLKHDSFFGREKENLVFPIVLDEGLLFRTNESAFVETKRKLVDECDLWAIVSLPGGVFSTAGAGVKTNLLFFTKGHGTKTIWYYDLAHVKVGKKTPLTLAHFGFDARTPREIINHVNQQGKIVADALARLNRLLDATDE